MPLDLKINILVVDDFATMRRTVKNVLVHMGFASIDEAADGGAAFQMMQHKTYGLVISDWNMQPVSGIELVMSVRADGALAATPFIMVSSESAPDNLALARSAGVSDYVVKPFTADTLKQKIIGVLTAV